LLLQPVRLTLCIKCVPDGRYFLPVVVLHANQPGVPVIKLSLHISISILRHFQPALQIVSRSAADASQYNKLRLCSARFATCDAQLAGYAGVCCLSLIQRDRVTVALGG
jgi:hypothetical protein